MHDCIQEENIGALKEFMASIKGLKATLFLMGVTIVTQVITFAFLWGGLTTTVKYHEVSISKILDKLDKVIWVAYAGEKDNTK
jgi:hypothetical protein